MNCLLAYSGMYQENLKLVCTNSPCLNCAKHIATFKHGAIKEVYFIDKYEKEYKKTKKIFKKCGILLKQI